MKYYIGIDLGGTFIKGGVCSAEGEILAMDSVPTEVDKGNIKVVENISALALSLCKTLNISASDCEGMGVGVPGMIDSQRGVIIYAGNLNFKNFPLQKELEDRVGIKVTIANDANVAALGEAKFGAGAGYSDSVLVTLGTGVGGGIIIDGKIFAGNCSAGAEIGHMIIDVDGWQCTCGLKGCLETYASATGLIKLTKEYMSKDENSLLWNIGIDNINGQSAFSLAEKDATAKLVVEKYLDYLSVGLVNIANVFRPQAILLGGGISNEGEGLVIPLREKMSKMIFAGEKGPKVDIKIASLKNKAGLLGAIALLI